MKELRISLFTQNLKDVIICEIRGFFAWGEIYQFLQLLGNLFVVVKWLVNVEK